MFNYVVEQRHLAVDFLTIYIIEAHPEGSWSFPSHKYSMKQAETLDNRIAAAHVIRDDVTERCPIAVDLMDNDAAAIFRAFPERLYVIDEDRIVYKGRPGPCGYNLNDMTNFLDELFILKGQVQKPV